MVNDKITLNFEIEKGEPIDRYYFSARIKLTDGSKNFLREKLGSTIQLDNLDDHFNLNHKNFYIYYNKYSEYNGRSELYVRDDNGRSFTSNLPLNHYGFLIELSSDGASIVDYGFYPLAVIYNPNHYNKAKEKVFDDHGKLLSVASNMLDNFLNNKNNLTTQDVLQNVFLHLQKEAAKEIEKLEREREEEIQREEELNEKNEELKELVEKDEIKIFKVVKGNDLGNGHSAVVLQLDGEEGDKIPLDSSKYYIAEYRHHPEWEGDEYLNFVSPDSDMLVNYENLFFVLNQSSYSDFESGFYSADSTDPHNYAKYSKEPYLSGDQLSEKLSNELEEDSNQIGTEFTIDDEQVDEEVVVESEAKSGEKGTVGEDNAKNTIQEEESNYIDQMQADDSSSYVEDQPALQSNRDDYADTKKALQEKLRGDEIRKQSNEKAKKDIEVKKVTVENDSSSNKTEKQTKPIEDEQKTVMASVIENNDDEDLNAKDSMGYTALHKAVFSKHFDEVKLLIDKGARVDVQDKHELTPLFYAVMRNDEKMIKFLVETGNANVNLGKYNNPLSIAISHGYMELAEYLINKGANLDQQDSIGRTLLHKVAEDGNLAAVKFLVDKGAKLDVLDKWKETPLHVAANVKVNKGHTEIVDYLIQKGADINLTHNYTPIHLAITRGNLDMVKCLMDNNADLYVKRTCDGTPLAYAKQQGQMEIVNYMDSIISNLSRSKNISLDKTNINIKYDLADNKLNMIEKRIKDAVQNFKGAFNTSDHDIKINAYIFNTQNDFKEYLKKVGFDAGNGVNGYTKMIDLSKGNAADVYIYLDSRGNFSQHTLEHEIGHAMHFANLGLSYILPKAMHEAIANYVAGLENGRHINDHGDKEALAEIRNKNLKPDEILRNDYQGKHYYSEAEQVVKFLEHKHPDLIDNLLKSLSSYGYHGRPQADKLVEDFLTELKGYDQEFKEWVKVQLSSKEHSQHKDMEVNQPTINSNNDNQHSEQQGKSRQKREVVDEDEQETVMASVIENMDKNSDIEAETSNSVANSQHPLKIKTGSPLEVGKYKVELQVTYDDVKNFYDTVRGKYHAGDGYNYEQVMVLYNEIVRPAHNHRYEQFTLDEAHVANDHLFIKGQDFGTLHDFNEMFYKSDELI